jgi:hypothetical protein
MFKQHVKSDKTSFPETLIDTGNVTDGRFSIFGIRGLLVKLQQKKRGYKTKCSYCSLLK